MTILILIVLAAVLCFVWTVQTYARARRTRLAWIDWMIDQLENH